MRLFERVARAGNNTREDTREDTRGRLATLDQEISRSFQVQREVRSASNLGMPQLHASLFSGGLLGDPVNIGNVNSRTVDSGVLSPSASWENAREPSHAVETTTSEAASSVER